MHGFVRVVMVVAVLLANLTSAGAQTPVAAPTAAGPGSPPAASSSMSWLPIAAMIGGAYLGTMLARRYLGGGVWFTMMGARLGSMLGLDVAAGALAIGEAVGGGAAPVVRSAPAAASWTI